MAALAAPSASSLYKQGRKAEARGDFANAYLLYSQAVALAPKNAKYWRASQAVRGLGTDQLTVDSNVTSSGPGALPPVLPDATEIEAQALLPPPSLKGAPGKHSFDLRGTPQELFEKVAQQYSLKVVFDSDYPPPAQPQPLRFKIDDASYQTALRALENLTSSFIVPVSERILLVAKDTQQKRVELEPVVSTLIPFPENIVAQDVTELANGARQIFDITKIGIDATKRVIYLRDRVSRVRAAKAMMEQLIAHRAQVFIEVELLAVSDSMDRSYGMNLPSQFTLLWLTNKDFLRPSPVPAWVAGLLTFGGGYTLFGLGIMNASLFASATESHTKSIVRTSVRSLDGQAAGVHVGDRYPIITLGYYGEVPAGAQKVYTPPPNITFEDLGIVLKVTPKVHNLEEVSLDVEAEFKSLAGQSFNGIPVISNRKFKSVVRMRFDEAAIMAGLVGDTFSQSWNGLPGLAALPPFRSNSKSRQQNEILLVIRPHLASLPPSEAAPDSIWSGTDTRSLSALD